MLIVGGWKNPTKFYSIFIFARTEDCCLIIPDTQFIPFFIHHRITHHTIKNRSSYGTVLTVSLAR